MCNLNYVDFSAQIRNERPASTRRNVDVYNVNCVVVVVSVMRAQMISHIHPHTQSSSSGWLSKCCIKQDYDCAVKDNGNCSPYVII